jgi:site-specific recombinase XerD
MIEDMQLCGYAKSTQNSYLWAVESLAKYHHRPPDRLGDEEVRQYFLHLINDKQVSASTLHIHRYGIRFFFERTLGQTWPVLDLVYPKKRKKLPVVLSRPEVQRVLSCVHRLKLRVCLTVIYSCGLRISEGRCLQVRDIDSDRMQVHVRDAKGGKDRYVPLPGRCLDLLRAYWAEERPPRPWLFPVRNGHHPVDSATVQKAFRWALRESRVKKTASVHTLRHSYATHLVESGLALHLIQQLLGHKSPKTTVIYTHLTQKIKSDVRVAVNDLMTEL